MRKRTLLVVGIITLCAGLVSKAQHAGDSGARSVATSVNMTHAVAIYTPHDNNTINCVTVQNIGWALVCVWGGSSNDVANGYWLNPTTSTNGVGGSVQVCINNGYDNRTWWGVSSTGVSRVQVTPEMVVNP